MQTSAEGESTAGSSAAVLRLETSVAAPARRALATVPTTRVLVAVFSTGSGGASAEASTNDRSGAPQPSALRFGLVSNRISAVTGLTGRTLRRPLPDSPS